MLTRGNVEALTKQVTEPLPAFEAALEKKDVDQAAAIALAAVLIEKPLPYDMVMRIAADVSLPDVLLPLFAAAPGPHPEPTDLDEHRLALLTAAEVARAKGKPSKALIDRVADQIVQSVTDASYELLVACAWELDVPEIFAARHSVKTYLPAAEAREVWATVKRDIAKPLQILPEHELSLPVVSLKRSAEGPSRNDPCPCGSGQKFKKCHGADGSTSMETGPAKTRAERLAAIVPQLEPKHVVGLTATDLKSLDLEKLPLRLGFAVFREWTYRQRWDQAELAVGALVKHPEAADKADGLRDELMWQALQRGRLDTVHHQRKKVLKPEDLSPVLEIHEALLAPWPDWLELIEEVCSDHLQSGYVVDVLDLTYVLLQRAPALGLLVAAGQYPRLNVSEAEQMYVSMDDARDRMGLAALKSRTARKSSRVEVKKEPKKAADPKAKAKIRALETTLEESKRKMRQIEKQLEEEQSKSPDAAVVVEAPGARKAYAQRIDALEDRIRDGNAERAQLRREVAELTERLAEAAPVAKAPELEVADEPGESASRPRGLMVTQWEPRAVESLEALPSRVSEDVLVRLAELGGGDAAHWIEVKQLQAVAGLYSARVGIHYRVMFTIEGKTLKVHEVVHREGFDTALRRFK